MSSPTVRRATAVLPTATNASAPCSLPPITPTVSKAAHPTTTVTAHLELVKVCAQATVNCDALSYTHRGGGGALNFLNNLSASVYFSKLFVADLWQPAYPTVRYALTVKAARPVWLVRGCCWANATYRARLVTRLKLATISTAPSVQVGKRSLACILPWEAFLINSPSSPS